MAIADGTVTLAGPYGGYGNFVRVDHGNGIVSEYGHLSQINVAVGATVKAGQVIALSGNTGNTTGPHLHLNIKVNGAYNDPAVFLAGAGNGTPIVGSGCGSADLTGQYGNVAWGGFQNGRIPEDQLCPLAFSPNNRLRCDAARSLEQLNNAFKATFASDLVVTDSYRSYDAQVLCRQNKGSLCAVPGTSNHGWGMAVDLGSGVNLYSSNQHAWMEQHAQDFGWVLPGWAQQNGSKPEPWHWEFGTIS
jgi:hypothetical protein